MARETTFPRVFTIIAEDVAGNGAAAKLTVAHILAGASQAVAIEEIIVTSTEVVEDQTCKVRIVRQADDGTYTLGPADTTAAFLNPGAGFAGEIEYLATVEPTDGVNVEDLRHAEVFRLGIPHYERFLPGSMLIFPGERFGVTLTDTDGAVTYTVKITCSYE